MTVGECPKRKDSGGCPKRKDSGNGGMPYEDQEVDQVVRESENDPMNSGNGGMPQRGMSLQISIRWKWLKGTLRVSDDAPPRAHIDEKLRNNGQ